MPDPNDSPAVQSYNAERARTRTAKDPLEQGLEDSFPASDPVSAVHTSAANVRDDGANSSEDEYPLVDEALRSTRHSSFGDGSERVQALRRDAARITGQASEVASGTADLARDEWRSFVRGVEGRIRERPLTAVGIVAALAYIWGATR